MCVRDYIDLQTYLEYYWTDQPYIKFMTVC